MRTFEFITSTDTDSSCTRTLLTRLLTRPPPVMQRLYIQRSSFAIVPKIHPVSRDFRYPPCFYFQLDAISTMPAYESRLAGAQAWVDPASLPQYGDASQIAGNAPDYVKQLSSNTLGSYGVGDPDCFAYSAGRAIRITRVDVNRTGNRWEACTISEVTVNKNMLNGAGMMHGGCLCYMIDNCASLPLVVLGLMKNVNGVGVSQAMNTVFHAPAPLGARLRIESTSVTLGGRIMTSRCEVSDFHSGRTVASAFLTKMQPKL